MAEKNYRIIVPPFWGGIRDNISKLSLKETEWQDALNMDGQGSRRGLTEVEVPEVGVEVRGLHFFRKPDTTQGKVVVLANGKLLEDGVQKLADLSGQAPQIIDGLGACVVFDPGGQPRWRNPADGVWGRLPVPASWTPTRGAFDPLIRRLFVAPTDLGPDTWGWSAVEDLTKWLGSEGGGQEPVGADNQAFGAIGPAVGDNMAIYKWDRIYVREGGDPATWQFRMISADVGTKAPRTVKAIGHGNHFVHGSGLSLLNAVGSLVFPPLTDPIAKRWDVLARIVDFTKGHATWDAFRQILYLWLPDNAGEIQRCFSFNFRDSTVFEHVIQANCSAFDDMDVQIGRKDGRISKLLGTTDHGVAITSFVRTKLFGDPMTQKGWGANRQVVVLLDGANGGTVTITPTIFVENTTQVGTAIVVNLTGTIVRARIPLAPQQGWGIELRFDSTSPWEYVGLLLPEELYAEI